MNRISRLTLPFVLVVFGCLLLACSLPMDSITPSAAAIATSTPAPCQPEENDPLPCTPAQPLATPSPEPTSAPGDLDLGVLLTETDMVTAESNHPIYVVSLTDESCQCGFIDWLVADVNGDGPDNQAELELVPEDDGSYTAVLKLSSDQILGHSPLNFTPKGKVTLQGQPL